jgi:hypothetical protein
MIVAYNISMNTINKIKKVLTKGTKSAITETMEVTMKSLFFAVLLVGFAIATYIESKPKALEYELTTAIETYLCTVDSKCKSI